MKFDDVQVVFEDQKPIIEDSRTLVPVRGVFEVLGFGAEWDEETQLVTLTRSDTVILITINSDVFTTNRVSYMLDVPAQLIGGRTMLPLRAVLESVGYSLEWEEDTNTVLVFNPASIPTEASAQIPALWDGQTKKLFIGCYSCCGNY